MPVLKTTTSKALEARQLKLGLEAGIVENREVIRWADNLLENEPYNDDIANVSLAEHVSSKELQSLLEKIAAGTSEWDGLRLILGRLHQCLVETPVRMQSFVHFLTTIWRRNGCVAPSDLYFIVGLEDAFLLSAEGIFGSRKKVRAALLRDLAQFSEAGKNGE